MLFNQFVQMSFDSFKLLVSIDDHSSNNEEWLLFDVGDASFIDVDQAHEPKPSKLFSENSTIGMLGSRIH